MSKLILILKLLPVIIEAVRAIEAAVPVEGKGKEKLDLVLGTIEDAYAISGEIAKELPADRMVSLATGLVGRVVGTFNALGVFKGKA